METKLSGGEIYGEGVILEDKHRSLRSMMLMLLEIGWY